MITSSDPRVTYSDPKVTYSDAIVTHSDPTHHTPTQKNGLSLLSATKPLDL